jgi:hypothetical protein
MSPDTERMLIDALETCHAWVSRWATHIGRCEGGEKCICGRTLVMHESSAALSAADREAKSGGELHFKGDTVAQMWFQAGQMAAAATIERLTRELAEAREETADWKERWEAERRDAIAAEKHYDQMLSERER